MFRVALILLVLQPIVVGSETIPAITVNNSKLQDSYTINGTNIRADTWQGVCQILGYPPTDIPNGEWCVNDYGNPIYVQGGDLCADGTFRVPLNCGFCEDAKPHCPNGKWTLSSDKKTCYRKDEACITKPELFTEEKLLAGIVYGESSTQYNFNEMAAIASAVVRRRDAVKQSSVNNLVLRYKNFSYVVYNNNPRFKKLMCAQSEAEFDLAYKAARNALHGGKDYSNGGCFWDGYDLKTSGTRHPKYRDGFYFSDRKHNIFAVTEPEPVIRKSKYGYYSNKYVSTAAFGNTIFWKVDNKFLLATGGMQCR